MSQSAGTVQSRSAPAPQLRRERAGEAPVESHLSHSAPAGDTGEAVGSAADPLALHSLDIAIELAGQGRLWVPVAATFPLTEAAAAHELSERPHARGKIVLVN